MLKMNPLYDSIALIKKHPYRRWISSFVNCIYVYFYSDIFILGKYLNFNDIYFRTTYHVMNNISYYG